MLRLTTRGIKTAGAIRDRVEFKTSGSLEGGFRPYWGTGHLNSTETAAFYLDREKMDYIVYSYATPIAWHVTGPNVDRWHIVNQKFSLTTTKHQGNLYLAKQNV